VAFFIALALGLCLPYAPLSADAGTTAVSVSAPSQPVASGQQFTVSIVVVPNTDLSGLQFNLHFDPAFVSIDSVQEGNLLAQNGATTYFNPGQIDNQAGTLTGAFGVITSPGQTISAQGTLAVITLTAKAQGGACPLGLSNVVAGDINGNSIPVSAEEAAVTVAAVRGQVFNWWALSVILGLAVLLIGATVAGILLRRRYLLSRALEGDARGRGA
jgi:archaellum component FlaG (FlaF/FlaG flagellin family)